MKPMLPVILVCLLAACTGQDEAAPPSAVAQSGPDTVLDTTIQAPAVEPEGFQYIRGKLSGDAVVSNGSATFRFVGDAAEATYYQLAGVPEKDKGCSPGGTKRQSGLLCTNLARAGAGNGKDNFECFLNINLNTGLIEENRTLCSVWENADKKLSLEGRGSVSVYYNGWDFKAQKEKDPRTAVRALYLELNGEVLKSMYAQMPGDAVESEKAPTCTVGMAKFVDGLVCTKGDDWKWGECSIEVNLATGLLEPGVSGTKESCPEESESQEDAERDAAGNREPLPLPPTD
jgi:hypothetical protein